MHRMLLKFVACVTLLGAGQAWAQETPETIVTKSVDIVLNAIRETRDRQKLIEVVEQRVLPYFDFTRMTRLALGRNWSDASDEQKKTLERAFRTLLVRTYTTALQRSSGEAKVTVRPNQVGPNETETVVRTVATEPGSQPIQIDYRMEKSAQGWKVYDVVVENLSLVTNYRGSFQSEISRSGIDGLIKVIEDKNRTAAST